MIASLLQHYVRIIIYTHTCKAINVLLPDMPLPLKVFAMIAVG